MSKCAGCSRHGGSLPPLLLLFSHLRFVVFARGFQSCWFVEPGVGENTSIVDETVGGKPRVAGCFRPLRQRSCRCPRATRTFYQS